MGKPQENTMFMVCALGSEGKLVDAASFPFHDYFPVNAPEPMRPSLMNGQVYIKHTFSNGFPVLDSAASLVRSTGVPDAVVQRLQASHGISKADWPGCQVQLQKGIA